MDHRHLNHDEFTLASIDGLIERGDVEDWLRLAREIRQSQLLAARVRSLCDARLGRADPEFYSIDGFRYWRTFVDTPQSDQDVSAAHDRTSA